ncbi:MULTISPECIES: TIGR01777 family oxidoreductase [unclassified Niallia]|uniref:TIGR01777 family oxidoreductase n=1 Tax=unclassified Niallia TaxID=2837522 RepID=UPI001EDC412C|nr:MULTISPECIES: TIGR01777 family oxidoreductase [unclassified Niallia]MCM3031579.1 TIGR01777 family oxidoreductase [Niallia sp. MER 6]MDL0435494.1 TIGR01777 family oxidoreductase [Niallia sp. SS-2023]UPO88184.1 TIGR01777 family oxidoreductase [Niallia sp. Man26]
MNFLIAGGTGLIGNALIKSLTQKGHAIYCLTRSKNRENSGQLFFVNWDDALTSSSAALPAPIDIVINLAGESLNSGRWTSERKERIVKSRVKSTDRLLSIIRELPNRPKLWMNASAIGVYGTSLSMKFTEESSLGNDFLADTVKQWEAHAAHATEQDIRTVFCRFGLVLSEKGGALPKLLLPYKLFAGGNLGSGNQWASWIHIKDVVAAMEFIINNNSISGPVNFTAPAPVKMSILGKAIGRQLGRPHWLPVPAPFLKLALGEMSVLVAEGQHVFPSVLTKHGYTFTYETIDSAIASLC